MSQEPSDIARDDANVETVQTRSYEARFSRADALPVQWDLIDSEILRDPIPLIASQLVAKSGVKPLALVISDDDQRDHQAPAFERSEEGDNVVLRFDWPADTSGLSRVRTYRIPKEGYTSKIELTFTNEGTSPINIDRNGAGPGLLLGPGLGQAHPSSGGLGGSYYVYVRPAWHTGSEVDQLAPEPGLPPATFPEGDDELRWAGLHSRYFAALLIPDPATPSLLSSGRAWLEPEWVEGSLLAEDALPFYPLVEISSEPLVIAPGTSLELSYLLYLGPKDRLTLQSANAHLDDLLFPGLWNWLRWLCFLLLAVLKSLNGVLLSWGLSIIALAVAVRIITFPVAQVGLRQQAKTAAEQAKLKPFIAEIDEQYKGDAGKKSEALMQLYKEHGISPFGAFKGCLWVVLQIPIFVALFNLLGQSFDLRGASFLWISDLSQPDRLFPLGINLPLIGSYFNILPLFMAASQVLVTQLSATPATDPAEGKGQKRTMFALAAVFLVLFYSFPSGLVLYWMMSNLCQLLQQSLMQRKLKGSDTR